MKILVTNDDGIDSLGLHVLARSLLDLGEVTIAAPDQEYSGAGAAIGALHISRPEVHQVNIDKIEKFNSRIGFAVSILISGFLILDLWIYG